VVEDRTEDIPSVVENRYFAEVLTVGLEELIQAIHMDDYSNATERTVPQFVRFDPEVPIHHIDEPTENIDEKAITSTHIVGLARQQIFVDFGIPSKAAA
jgi:hypothetical protein